MPCIYHFHIFRRVTTLKATARIRSVTRCSSVHYITMSHPGAVSRPCVNCMAVTNESDVRVLHPIENRRSELRRAAYARPHAPARRPTLGARAESRRPDDASGLTCKEELQARAETPDYTSPESASNARCTSYGLTHADAYLCLMYSLAMTCQLCLRPIALSEMRCWQ